MDHPRDHSRGSPAETAAVIRGMRRTPTAKIHIYMLVSTHSSLIESTQFLRLPLCAQPNSNKIDPFEKEISVFMNVEIAINDVKEMRVSNDIARWMRSLTSLTFLFIPASFVPSIFGMNVVDFGGPVPVRKFISVTPRLFFGTLLILTLVVTILYCCKKFKINSCIHTWMRRFKRNPHLRSVNV